MAYNAIYEKLTADPNDLVGAFAYIIYKQQKVDFCRSHPQGSPSREELERFHAIAALETSIAAYRAQGEAMAQAFLNAREVLIHSGGCNRSLKKGPARRNTADMPGHGEDLQRRWALFERAECAVTN